MIRFGEAKYGFLGRVTNLEGFNPPSDDTMHSLRGRIDEAFGRSQQPAPRELVAHQEPARLVSWTSTN